MPKELKPCGTRAAYERHRRRARNGIDEPYCEACNEANNAKSRKDLAKKRLDEDFRLKEKARHKKRYATNPEYYKRYQEANKDRINARRRAKRLADKLEEKERKNEEEKTSQKNTKTNRKGIRK